tara:strand:- start:254 stop:901 length:648 start_codon:yes stop_codon:yes gene_type:complete
MIIAIDGPSASGKSTTARGVAKKLGITHLDTGAMYRAVTWEIMEIELNILDENVIDDYLNKLKIHFDSLNNIYINGKNVFEEIRKSEISSRVSEISAIPRIRRKMVEIQRRIGFKGDCVLEGRDIGTVVFPNADFKFFLIADIIVRARRRLEELNRLNETSTLNKIIKNIKHRDEMDSKRDYSPLIKAEDAIIIDTGTITIDEQINMIIEIVNNK